MGLPRGQRMDGHIQPCEPEETEEAKRIIEMEKAMEQEGVKCFVVMAKRRDLAKFRGAESRLFERKPSSNQWWPP